MDGRTRGLRGRLACHCLLLESGSELVLVDTGLGLRDVADPRGRLSRFFLALLDPDFREEMTAVRQIVLTHLDFDHAGGLDDFPHAAVHMLGRERDAAMRRETLLDRMRYRPQQWSTRGNWRVYEAGEGEGWYGFACARDLGGVPPEVLLVPLLGHTFGHAGVAVQGEDGWLLLAGDAYFYHAEMDIERPRCTPGLRFYQWMMEKDRRARLWNQARLRNLRAAHGQEVTIASSHDAVEFERLACRPLAMPAEPAPQPVRAAGLHAPAP
jgi:glyoxylase-like metal-dependent hydrolase (beta-lactamase superfamily II)